ALPRYRARSPPQRIRPARGIRRRLIALLLACPRCDPDHARVPLGSKLAGPDREPPGRRGLERGGAASTRCHPGFLRSKRAVLGLLLPYVAAAAVQRGALGSGVRLRDRVRSAAGRRRAEAVPGAPGTR